jgi:large subunit ribosomal protein L13
VKLGGKFMRTTFMANASNIERKWYVVDAAGKTLGRLSTEVATLLRGKHKPTYTPHVDTGDNVIIINAEKIELTGNKLNDKIYYRHSQFPGGLKSRTALEMRTNYPTKMLELAIKGMLPKGSLGRQMGKKLHVYAGSEHPHQAQQPEVYELRG